MQVQRRFTEGEIEAATAMLASLGIEEAATPEQYEEFVQHAATMAKCLSLLWAKRGYGASWRSHGYLGSVLKASIKTNRLMNLLWYRQGEGVADEAGNEDAGDTFLDLANYAIFGYEQWREGDERGTLRSV
jgi:hypothetical protein